jgi:hypothetical protein
MKNKVFVVVESGTPDGGVKGVYSQFEVATRMAGAMKTLEDSNASYKIHPIDFDSIDFELFGRAISKKILDKQQDVVV